MLPPLIFYFFVFIIMKLTIKFDYLKYVVYMIDELPPGILANYLFALILHNLVSMHLHFLFSI